MTKTPLALALGVALWAAAPAPSADKGDAIPADAADPAFDRYLDLKALGQALADQKPEAVADIAIKLAEGEKALGRKHKSVSSAKLFDVAVGLAQQQKDKDTLAKLGKAAKDGGNKDLTEMVEKAEKLVAGMRKVDPDAAALAKATSEQKVVFRSLAEQIRSAKTLGDRTELEGLEKSIGKMDDFDAGLKAALLQKVSAAKEDLPPKSDPQMDVLARLASASRMVNGGGAFVVVKVTLENLTGDPVTVDYATHLGQKTPDVLAAKAKKTYNLQFVKEKPAAIVLGKEALTVKDGAAYRVEKAGDKLKVTEALGK